MVLRLEFWDKDTNLHRILIDPASYLIRKKISLILDIKIT